MCWLVGENSSSCWPRGWHSLSNFAFLRPDTKVTGAIADCEQWFTIVEFFTLCLEYVKEKRRYPEGVTDFTGDMLSATWVNDHFYVFEEVIEWMLENETHASLFSQCIENYGDYRLSSLLAREEKLNKADKETATDLFERFVLQELGRATTRERQEESSSKAASAFLSAAADLRRSLQPRSVGENVLPTPLSGIQSWIADTNTQPAEPPVHTPEGPSLDHQGPPPLPQQPVRVSPSKERSPLKPTETPSHRDGQTSSDRGRQRRVPNAARALDFNTQQVGRPELNPGLSDGNDHSQAALPGDSPLDIRPLRQQSGVVQASGGAAPPKRTTRSQGKKANDSGRGRGRGRGGAGGRDGGQHWLTQSGAWQFLLLCAIQGRLGKK